MRCIKPAQRWLIPTLLENTITGPAAFFPWLGCFQAQAVFCRCAITGERSAPISAEERKERAARQAFQVGGQKHTLSRLPTRLASVRRALLKPTIR
jgi:hypothetical protein